jgi:uncharacterized protein YbbK (DUF523 family)
MAGDARAVPKSIRLGASSCLVGAAARFDGGQGRERCTAGVLGQSFERAPFSPEMAAAPGAPRPTIPLPGAPCEPRAVGLRDVSADVARALVDAPTRDLDGCATLEGRVPGRASASL